MTVIISGGGPVGLLLAGELRLAGVEVTVLERLAEPSGHSRAFRLQARTLELLEQRGLLGSLSAPGKQWPHAHYAGLRPLLDLSRLDTAHPYALLVPQARTEAALGAYAQSLGADIRRGHELTGLSQKGDVVTAEVRGPAGTYRLDGEFLVGCDGGRSTVRKAVAISFDGVPGRASCLLGDVRLADPGQLPSGVPGTLRTDNGLLMAVSLEEGVTRVLVTEFDQPHRDAGQEVTLDELRDAVRRVSGVAVTMDEPRWLSRFSDASLLARTYRAGRVLLAGDAAHVHFPIGAQGLNLGLQDAVNLGWKLAAAVHGRAPDDLLDSYSSERRPAARRVLQETRTQLALMMPGDQVTLMRDFVSELLALPEVNLLLARTATGLDIHYDTGAHPLIGHRTPELTVAGRGRIAELLRRGRGLLLDFSRDSRYAKTAERWAPQVDSVIADQDADGFTAMLVRPDGYVAWAVGPEDAGPDDLTTALTRWFGTPEE